MSLLEVLNGKQSQDKADAIAAERYARSQGDASGGMGVSDPYSSMCGQLESYIESCWQAAKSGKESIVEPEMLEDIRQRDGIYSPTKLSEIRKQGGSEIYMQLTNVKCRAAHGWLRDILLPSGERPFTASPPPVPDDLEPDIKQGIYQRTIQDLQQALESGMYVTPEQVYERARAVYDDYMMRLKDESKIRAAREEDAIDTELLEGHWYDAMEDFLQYLVDSKAAFVKGPVIRKERRLQWSKGPDGKPVPVATDELVPVFYSPNPLDIYPAPDSIDVDDGYLLERLRPRRSAIYAMIGVPGYDEKKIRAALEEYQKSGFDLPLVGEFQRRFIADQRNYLNTPDHGIDSLEFHGSVRGKWLLDWGLPAHEVKDADAEYEVTCLKIGRFVVRCVLNEDPMGRRPYMKASYDSVSGSFWGRGVPELIKDLQGICNAAARALVNNMGMSSGPAWEVEVDRLAEGEDITQFYPWRFFQTKASKTTPGPAIRAISVDSHAEELMGVFSFFSKLADDYCGIPSYEQGTNPTQGAAGTASGLSMLMTAASRQIKRVIASIDDVIEGSVQRMHTHLMLYEDNPDIRGETTIIARGAASLVAKEQQQMRRTQFLQMVTNPIDAPIIGPVGRAELLRETLKSLDMNPDNILPSRDEMLAKVKAAQAGPPQMGGPPGQPPQQGGPPGPPQLPPPQQGQPPAQDVAGNPAGGVTHALFGQQRAA